MKCHITVDKQTPSSKEITKAVNIVSNAKTMAKIQHHFQVFNVCNDKMTNNSPGVNVNGIHNFLPFWE